MTEMTYDAAEERAAGQSVDRSIPFIETHHHLWELGRFKYDWLTGPCWDEQMGDYKAICVDWGPGRFFREFYGQNVIKSVHVEADYSGLDPVEETVWLEAVGNAFGYPNALVVMCDLEGHDAEAELIRHLEASPRVRGVRLRGHPDNSDSPAFKAGYVALGRLGLSYELNASPGKLMAGRAVAKAYPDTQMILGHAGYPVARTAEYFKLWRHEISAVAEVDNVACKISGFASVDHSWSVESLRPWVLHCIEAFGVDRSMFGTNWPVDVLYAPYMEQVDAWRRIISDAGFSRHEQEQLLYGNAERLYQI
jgi:predicted TIM-barrel fold metal-dependent hydrolase